MTTLAELEKLPETIKAEVLKYAEYLLRAENKETSPKKSKWLRVVARGKAIGKTGSQTVVEMREEEQW
jgi:hypothetical protein